MKTRNFKIAAVLLVMTTFFHSCNKNDIEAPNHYVGKWKLMSRSLIGDLYLIGSLDPPMVDYSETGINYEFERDGIMNVSGEAAYLDLEWYAENGLLDLFFEYEVEAGVYSYSTIFLGSDGWVGWDLKIDGENCRLIVEEDKTQMRIYKTISYADLPSTKSDPAPTVMFGFHLEKIEE
jgi:hypothetical protein